MKVIFALIDLTVQTVFWALVGLWKAVVLLGRLASWLWKSCRKDQPQPQVQPKVELQQVGPVTDGANPTK